MGTRSRRHRYQGNPPAGNSSPVGQIGLDEWVKTTVQTDGFGRSEFKELEDYKKLSAKRKLQASGGLSSIASKFVPTKLTANTKQRLLDAALTVVQGVDRDDENIFELETDTCECGLVESRAGWLLFWYFVLRGWVAVCHDECSSFE